MEQVDEIQGKETLGNEFLGGWILEEEGRKTLFFWIYPGHQELSQLEERLYSTEPRAYMNGYNYAALIEAYLRLEHPELSQNITHDAEAGGYWGYLPFSDDGKSQLRSIVPVLIDWFSDHSEVVRWVEANTGSIYWD